MDPTGVTLIVAGAVVVLGILAYFTFKSYYGIAVSTTSVTTQVNVAATMTATLKYKSWGFGSWTNVGGTFAIRALNVVNPVVGATPASTTTTGASPAVTVTITGVRTGNDTVHISGTPSGASGAEVADIAVTVASGS